MEKIRYSVVLKNKSTKTPKYYGRIRMRGQEKLIPLSPVKAEADLWLRKVQRYYDEAVDLEAENKDVPDSLLSKIVTVDSMPVLARKRASEGVLSLRDILDRWEAKMTMEGKSRHTVAQYMRLCREVLDLDLPVTAFDKEMIDGIMARKAHLKSASRRHIAETLKMLARYLIEEYGAPHSILLAIPRIKAISDERPCWTREEMQSVIGAIEHPNKAVEEQFKLYCEVLGSIGSRQGETADLRWEDYHDGCFTFRAETTKSRLPRTVPVPTRLQMKLGKIFEPSGLIFDKIPRTQSGRFSLLAKAIQKSGVCKGSLHTFRHTVSTLLYREGCRAGSGWTLKDVSLVLGHDPLTAMKYYQATRGAEELRRLVDVDLPSW